MQWKVYNYFNGISKLSAYGWQITDMACVGAYTDDGTYMGTYPKPSTNDNATGSGKHATGAAALTYAAS